MEKIDHGLRRELKLRDLVPMQVVLVVGFTWTGFAAKQGSSQLMLWLVALLLFYLPLTAVVRKLSRAMPVEGGVYQWTKAGISPFAGYMAGWSTTMYAVFAFGATGSQLANGLSWAAGAAWLGTDKWVAFGLTAVFCALAWMVNARGLRLAKWLSDGSAAMSVATALALVYLLLKAVLSGKLATAGAISFTPPKFSLLTIGVLSKMSVGALSGVDSSAIFAEECRKPENDVARSVMMAAPVIALIYVLTTAALLAFTRPENLDLAAPLQQAVRAGFGTGVASEVWNAILLIVFSYSLIAAGVIVVGMVGRLPMVAGWDGLLPGWWSELEPSSRVPTKAIGAVCGAILLVGAASLWGAGNDEASQVVAAVAVGALCIMYMLLFGVIVFRFRDAPEPPGLGLRMAAAAGFTVAMVSFVLQILPLGEVRNRGVFAGKVAAGILLTYGLGAYLYWRGVRRLGSSGPRAMAATG